jgi:hypothetical protein
LFGQCFEKVESSDLGKANDWAWIRNKVDRGDVRAEIASSLLG